MPTELERLANLLKQALIMCDIANTNRERAKAALVEAEQQCQQSAHAFSNATRILNEYIASEYTPVDQ